MEKKTCRRRLANNEYLMMCKTYLLINVHSTGQTFASENMLSGACLIIDSYVLTFVYTICFVVIGLMYVNNMDKVVCFIWEYNCLDKAQRNITKLS